MLYTVCLIVANDLNNLNKMKELHSENENLLYNAASNEVWSHCSDNNYAKILIKLINVNRTVETS